MVTFKKIHVDTDGIWRRRSATKYNYMIIRIHIGLGTGNIIVCLDQREASSINQPSADRGALDSPNLALADVW